MTKTLIASLLLLATNSWAAPSDLSDHESLFTSVLKLQALNYSGETYLGSEVNPVSNNLNSLGGAALAQQKSLTQHLKVNTGRQTKHSNDTNSFFSSILSTHYKNVAKQN